jgi:hypothetical protein
MQTAATKTRHRHAFCTLCYRKFPTAIARNAQAMNGSNAPKAKIKVKAKLSNLAPKPPPPYVPS